MTHLQILIIRSTYDIINKNIRYLEIKFSIDNIPVENH